ncbi:sigma-70 family RNA polymerase sigma factor [Fusobacterium necrophorum]|uniref:sigma-70 family RNA polymerase sigma factor n=1 Tax=Fusobacterium necrophorum TaxID=859 RepID=UPI0007885F11|nr:sigma-70 family RNA polymerase sigma factor [Fusobacterium necrophorum]KYM44084.1 hypothetical protein A2U15_07245 [Fusobacterium necrophorum subsp. funduliforme]
METKETLELIRLAKQGDIKARNELIEKNINLVHKINRMYGSSEDGFQEGILAFCHAIDKFDETKKVKLSSYAFHWIRQRIKRYRDREKYRVPAHVIEKMTKEERKIRIDFEYRDFKSEDETTIEEENSICLKSTLEQYIKIACSEKEAFILQKIYFEGYQQNELAKEMGVCRQRINAIVKKSLQKIRRVFYEDNYHRKRKG